MKQVTAIKNEPAQMIAVSYFRTFRSFMGRTAGQVYHIPVAFVGSSAREVCADEANSSEAMRMPVVWRFVAGQASGGDDLQTDPAWHERRVEIPAEVTDVVKYLQDNEFEGADFRWYLMEKPTKRDA